MSGNEEHPLATKEHPLDTEHVRIWGNWHEGKQILSKAQKAKSNSKFWLQTLIKEIDSKYFAHIHLTNLAVHFPVS